LTTFAEQVGKGQGRKCPVCNMKLQHVHERIGVNKGMMYLLHRAGLLETSRMDTDVVALAEAERALDHVDLQRLANYIAILQKRHRRFLQMADEDKHIPLVGHQLEVGDHSQRRARDVLVYHRLAVRRELKLPNDSYNFIMALNIPWDTITDEKLDEMHKLPVCALAANPCMILIAGTPTDTMSIARLMDAWGFTYKSVYAQVIQQEFGSKEKMRQKTRWSETVIMHAGAIGTVPCLDRSFQRGHTIAFDTFKYNGTDIHFYEALGRRLSFSVRLELFATRREAGYDVAYTDFF
jgi:N6-adenosine-specific RNA methylase IME4